MVPDPTLDELIRSASAGDADAQDRLVAAYTPTARAAAARLVNEPDLVDDVVQDAFVEILATLDQLREPNAFGTWVRLAVRKHADRHRRRSRATHELDDDELPRARDTADIVQQLDLVVGIQGVLASARAADRQLLALRYLGDWSVEELAEALAISPGAVRKRLHDARRRLRPALEALTQREDHTMTNYESNLGQVHQSGQLDLGTSAAEPTLRLSRSPDRTPMETGLKVLDAMAPIARGGTVELVGPVGTGHLVLVAELGARMQRAGAPAAVVAVGSTQRSVGATSNLAKLVTDLAANHRHAVVLSDDDEGAQRALHDGSTLAAGLAGDGVEVLLVVDKATCDAASGPAALKDLAGLSAGGGSVTLVLLDPFHRDADLPTPAGMDTRLVLSTELAALGLFPAIDPVASRSNVAGTTLSDDVAELLRRADQVRNYFKQEMIVAEEYTGEAPTWVDKEEAERALRDLVMG
jgi:RNA polymerase sigma-70 factor, ECF subfamily